MMLDCNILITILLNFKTIYMFAFACLHLFVFRFNWIRCNKFTIILFSVLLNKYGRVAGMCQNYIIC